MSDPRTGMKTFLTGLVTADNLVGTSAPLFGGQVHDTVAAKFEQPQIAIDNHTMERGVRIGNFVGPLVPNPEGAMVYMNANVELICFAVVDTQDSSVRGPASAVADAVARRVAKAIYDDPSMANQVKEAYVDPRISVRQGTDAKTALPFMAAVLNVKFTELSNLSIP